MKTLVVIVTATLVGCAQHRPYTPPQNYNQVVIGTHAKKSPKLTAVSIGQLDVSQVRVDQNDCRDLAHWEHWAEQDLARRGLARKPIEQMPPADQQHVSQVKTIVWSLRIGCNNPTRYAQQ